MIDKINGNNGYDFPDGSQNKKKNPAVRAYENTPGFEEAAKKRTSDVHKKRTAQSDEKDTGVILDLSGRETDKKKAAAPVSQKKNMAWTDVLRRFTAPILRWLKNFWESDATKEQDAQIAASEMPASEASAEDSGQNITPLEAADSLQPSGMQEVSPALETADKLDEYEAMKKAALKSGNLRQIEQLVTNNGTKRLAHNSDLLTYYDRRGKFVEMDETDKYRVLFGDKNILKL